MPEGPFAVTGKLDGSLIIATLHEGEWLVASRGSFVSDQAKWARDMMPPADEAWSHHTYLFELIHPENRIVVDYKGRHELVLLGIVHTPTGHEIPRICWPANWSHVPEYDAEALSPEELKTWNNENEEGFVLRWGCGTRVKVKFDEYCRLHKLITGISAKTIWRALVDGLPMDEFVEHVPDEFHEWFTGIVQGITSKAIENEQLAIGIANSARDLSTARKDQAVFIISQCKSIGRPTLQGLCFFALDFRMEDLRKASIKMAEPEFDVPFSTVEIDSGVQ